MLQLGKANHAAFVRHGETWQQIHNLYILTGHRVYACFEAHARFPETVSARHRFGKGAGLVKGSQRRPVHNDGDLRFVRPANTLYVIANIAKHESDFVEVAEVYTALCNPSDCVCAKAGVAVFVANTPANVAIADWKIVRRSICVSVYVSLSVARSRASLRHAQWKDNP